MLIWNFIGIDIFFLLIYGSRGLDLLLHYVTVNVEAFRKILKKHDKFTALNQQEEFTMNFLKNSKFFHHRLLKLLLEETEVTLK